jgi:hypothetical protein
MAFVRRHMLNVMKRGFVIAQNCRFPWLTQKELQVPLPTLKPVKESRVGKGISAQASHRTVLETLTSHGSSHSV